MTEALSRLPTVLILGALVVILLSMRREHRTAQFQLWISGWILIFLYFALQFLSLASNQRFHSLPVFQFTALPVAALLFMVSLSRVVDVPRPRLEMLLGCTASIGTYVWVMLHPDGHFWLGVVSLVGLLFFALRHVWRAMDKLAWRLLIGGLYVASTAWWIYELRRNNSEIAFYGCITILHATSGFLIFRKFRRATTGTVATSLGFFSWAAVTPILPIAHSAGWMLGANHGIWNVPKFIVAIGMVVTLIENERIVAEKSRQTIRRVNEQMRAFADLTYRLLGGADVVQLCPEIAQTVATVGNYDRVSIVLAGDDRRLFVAGLAGVTDAAEREHLTSKMRVNAVTSLEQVLLPERRIGANSFRSRTEELTRYGSILTGKQYPENPYWRSGDELVVPIRAANGGLLGCLSLDDPKDVTRVNAEDLSALEVLASEIGAALETSSLQRRLLRSEKLAGIGQLVGGVAHELNNPLTAVLGYSEMLAERAPDEGIKRDLGVVRREAMRMKRIIEDLQRFSRHETLERQSITLPTLVNDILALRKLDIHGRMAEITLNLPASLPAIQGDPAMLKQALLNIVSNALDAVENASERRITISAEHTAERVVLSVNDSGSGFQDPTRAFDPFYTTKPPGKGTGLGLSICYGIIKEHGGEIHAANLLPHGASVTIELPIAFQATPLASAANAQG